MWRLGDTRLLLEACHTCFIECEQQRIMLTSSGIIRWGIVGAGSVCEVSGLGFRKGVLCIDYIV